MNLEVILLWLMLGLVEVHTLEMVLVVIVNVICHVSVLGIGHSFVCQKIESDCESVLGIELWNLVVSNVGWQCRCVWLIACLNMFE